MNVPINAEAGRLGSVCFLWRVGTHVAQVSRRYFFDRTNP